MSEAAEDRLPQLALRDLPSVDHLLKQPAISNLLDEFPRSELVRAVREAVDSCRTRAAARSSTVIAQRRSKTSTGVISSAGSPR